MWNIRVDRRVVRNHRNQLTLPFSVGRSSLESIPLSTNEALSITQYDLVLRNLHFYWQSIRRFVLTSLNISFNV